MSRLVYITLYGEMDGVMLSRLDCICDSILHVNMFHYLKTPYIIFLMQNLSTINILDPDFFYHMLFYHFRHAPLPEVVFHPNSNRP